MESLIQIGIHAARRATLPRAGAGRPTGDRGAAAWEAATLQGRPIGARFPPWGPPGPRVSTMRQATRGLPWGDAWAPRAFVSPPGAFNLRHRVGAPARGTMTGYGRRKPIR